MLPARKYIATRTSSAYVCASNGYSSISLAVAKLAADAGMQSTDAKLRGGDRHSDNGEGKSPTTQEAT